MPKGTTLERLMSVVDMNGRINEGMTQCWKSTCSHSSAGYGQIMIHGKAWNTHRLSWWLHNGMPDDLESTDHIGHLCDNKTCCNPDHLERINARKNIIDSRIRGLRTEKPKKPKKTITHTPHSGDFKKGECSGEKNAAAKLSDEQVSEIRRRYDAGLKYRQLKAMAVEFGVSYGWIQQLVARVRRNFLN